MVGVGNGQPPDVEALVPPTPGRSLAAGTEGSAAVGPVRARARSMRPKMRASRPSWSFSSRFRLLPHPDVALGVGLERPAPFPERLRQSGLGLGPHDLQPLVGTVEVGLLGRHVRVRHSPNFNFARPAGRPARRGRRRIAVAQNA